MPVFESYDYCPKALIARRKKIERDLVRKGLKFQSVLHRKLRRR